MNKKLKEETTLDHKVLSSCSLCSKEEKIHKVHQRKIEEKGKKWWKNEKKSSNEALVKWELNDRKKKK